MTYHVRLIDDDQLPPDQGWAMVRCGDDCTCFVKPASLTPQTLERTWSAYQGLRRERVGASR